MGKRNITEVVRTKTSSTYSRCKVITADWKIVNSDEPGDAIHREGVDLSSKEVK